MIDMILLDISTRNFNLKHLLKINWLLEIEFKGLFVNKIGKELQE